MSDSIFVPIGGRPMSAGSDQWTGYTAIYGCVSVGNVPQLAIDLLVSTLLDANTCRPVGHLYSPALMPLSGPDAYRFGGQSLTTSAQVYESADRKLLIIQQRTPLYKELRKEFYEAFTKWLGAYRLKRVLILSSSFIEHLASALDSGDCYPMKYMTNATGAQHPVDPNWQPVERVDAFTLQASADGVLHLPGSGSLQELLKWLDKRGVPGVGLVLYCSEGDNRPHSQALLNAVNRWLNIVDFKTTDPKMKSWIVPFSWRQLFGDEPPTHIY